LAFVNKINALAGIIKNLKKGIPGKAHKQKIRLRITKRQLLRHKIITHLHFKNNKLIIVSN
jgi:hypothetical protein